MRVALFGAGRVGGALAVRWAQRGHEVRLAVAREGSASVAETLARDPRLEARPVAEAIDAAQVVVLATPFGALEGALPPLANELDGKVVVDATNPVGPGLTHGLAGGTSGSQVIQRLVPGARVVKAFSIYGFENLENAGYPGFGVRPAMFVCGDDAAAKVTVTELVEDCGFEALDVGGLVQALHLEHLALLWIRMARAGGHSPHFVWGVLRRDAPGP